MSDFYLDEDFDRAYIPLHNEEPLLAGQLPVVKAAQVLRALERTGFRQVDRAGSHVKLRRGAHIAIVPDHGGKDMPLGTLRSILKQAGITADEFRELL